MLPLVSHQASLFSRALALLPRIRWFSFPMLTWTCNKAVRSTNGCWTCRVRRKKCDEVQPGCSTCSSLELECYGYGPRPEWMDNGPLQQRQVALLKALVSQNKRPPRRPTRKSVARAHDFQVLQWDASSLEPPTLATPSSVATLPDTWNPVLATNGNGLPTLVTEQEMFAVKPEPSLLDYSTANSYGPARAFSSCIHSAPDVNFPGWAAEAASTSALNLSSTPDPIAGQSGSSWASTMVEPSLILTVISLLAFELQCPKGKR